MAEEKIVSKIPPQAIEAEKALLGCLLLDEEGIYKVVDYLFPEDFYQENHRKIYEAIIDLLEQNLKHDLLTLTERLKEKGELEKVGGASYLAELVESVPSPANLIDYAKIIKAKKNRRDLIKVSSEIIEMAYDETKDIDLVLDEAERNIFKIAQGSLTQDFIPIKEELKAAFERIEKIHAQKTLRGIPTGFSNLDQILAGLQQGDLILLASRPSLGKTALSLNIARHVAVKEKLPVGIFSLEMSREQIVDRLIAAQAGVSLWKLRTGKLSTDEEFGALQEALEVLSEAPIYIDDTPGSTVLRMRAMARRLQAKKGLALLVIDYLQLIQPLNPQESVVQQITEISRALKGLAKELKIPILAISQLSRAVEHRVDQRPRLSDLRESGSLEQESDVVLFIYREDKVKPTTPRQNIADIIIAKHRNGPVGQVELYFDPDTVSFREIERGYEPQEIESEDVL
jgi:replicative DNA helicase